MNPSSLLVDISQKIGKNLKFTDQKLHSALNNNWVVEDEEEKKYVLRIPKENSSQILFIREEYESIGYVENGSEYKFRTLEEQASFTEKCSLNNLPVPQIRYVDQVVMLRDFVEGVSLDIFLKQEESQAIIENHISTIIKAHKRDIVFGDRWGSNEICTRENKIIYIDFDIELTSKNAKEFEIAQVLYHCILQSKNKKEAVSIIKDLFTENLFLSYNQKRFVEFLQGHLRYFSRREIYCGTDPKSIEPEINQLISSL